LDEQKLPFVIPILQRYYLLKDLEEGSGSSYHLGIFNALYVNKQKLSDDKIAAEFFIGLKTLYNYKVSINKLAEQISIGKLFTDSI